jgi:hypothetical protein
MPGIVESITDKGEAGASVDPVGSVRVYVVSELKETGDGVTIPASKEEKKVVQQLGPLCSQQLESLYVSMSSLPIEEHYVRFEVFTAMAMKHALFWVVTPYVSCKNRRFGGMYRLHHQGDKNQRARNNVSSN